MNTIDLHMHSIHSDDGEFTPTELVGLAKDAGVDAIALTDHNTAAGVDEAVAAGEKSGIEVVPAIELDCRYGGIGLHVLGYGINHADPRFRELADGIYDELRKIGRIRAGLIENLGIAVDMDTIEAHARDGQIPGELVAEVAFADPRNDGNPLLAPYRLGGPKSTNACLSFYWDYCTEGKPAYVHIEFMPLADCLALIEDTDGVPVLAHPGANLKGREEVFAELAATSIAGVEAFCSYHTPAQAEFWTETARRHGKFVTCGSDFHGKIKPDVAFGGHGCPFADKVWDDLRDALAKRKSR